VVSDKMQKTVVVAVEWKQPHPKYKKLVRRRSKAYAHDEGNEAKLGDLVKIRETRPLSALKRWRLVQVLQKTEQVEVKPEEAAVAELKALEETPDDSDVHPA
jgi:small subunit ribosomal protein S17